MAVAWDSFVVTPEGLVAVSELNTSLISEQGTWRPVSVQLIGIDNKRGHAVATKYLGNKSCIYITTKLGYNIALSPDQLVYVLNTSPNYYWARAEELTTGDWMVIQLDSYPKDIKRKKFEIGKLVLEVPSKEAVKFAEWLGYFMADGFIVPDKYQIGYCIDHSDDGRIEQYLYKLTSELFGLSTYYTGESLEVGVYHGQKKAIYYEDKDFCESIMELVGDGNHIPKVIMQGGRQLVSGFVRGYATACCEPELTKRIRLFSDSYSLMNELQVLLASVGIISSVYTGITDRVVGENRDYVYYLYVVSYRGRKAFKETIGFFDSRQQETLERISQRWSFGTSDLIPCEIIEPTEKSVPGIKVKTIVREKLNTILDRHFHKIIRKESLLDVWKKNHLFDQIISIYRAEADMFEVRLEGNDNYLANNFGIKAYGE